MGRGQSYRGVVRREKGFWEWAFLEEEKQPRPEQVGGAYVSFTAAVETVGRGRS